MHEELKEFPPKHEEWVNEVLELFMGARSHREPYDIELLDMKIRVNPDVFSPKYFPDSAWYAKELPKIVGDRRLLEIGCGTGLVGLACAKSGAVVDFSDMNPAACECTKINVKRLKLSSNVYQGDLYSSIPKTKKYDYIFWNHPFNKTGVEKPDVLLKAGFDLNYVGLTNFISGSVEYLKDPSRGLLLGTGNHADLASIKNIADNYKYKLKLLRKEIVALAPETKTSNDLRIYGFLK